jgi:hypothetical protein
MYHQYVKPWIEDETGKFHLYISALIIVLINSLLWYGICCAVSVMTIR